LGNTSSCRVAARIHNSVSNDVSGLGVTATSYQQGHENHLNLLHQLCHKQRSIFFACRYQVDLHIHILCEHVLLVDNFCSVCNRLAIFWGRWIESDFCYQFRIFWNLVSNIAFAWLVASTQCKICRRTSHHQQQDSKQQAVFSFPRSARLILSFGFFLRHCHHKGRITSLCQCFCSSPFSGRFEFFVIVWCYFCFHHVGGDLTRILGVSRRLGETIIID